MPYRIVPCVTGELYHVFNRSIAMEVILQDDRDYDRLYNLVAYYRYPKPIHCYSDYHRLSFMAQSEVLQRMTQNEPIVDICGFSFMPTHFHFLLRQNIDNGISIFISQVQNGYAKYINRKRKRSGSAFQSMYKARLVESDEQSIHTLRYIHLNQLTAHIVNDIQGLGQYPWTSYIDYLGKRLNSFVLSEELLSQFPSKEEFERFTSDQIDYQRTLAYMKANQDEDD